MTLELPKVPPLNAGAEAQARARQNALTKPPGSLGRLEDLSAKLAAMTGDARPSFAQRAVIVFAADHGVADEGVSAYPPEVTGQMVVSFLRGGAAINALARQAGARLVVVNAGVGVTLPQDLIEKHRLDPERRLVDSPTAYGTANMAQGPAMTRHQAESAILLGLQTVREEKEKGLDLVGVGDMGIGNTTASAAIIAALTGEPARKVAGRGTGIDDLAFERKVAAIERALAVNEPERLDAFDVLRKVGGLEIAAIAGAIVGAAAARVPVVLDGYITAAAALAALRLVPEVKSYLIASHRSVEPGHAIALDALGLAPLLDLGLRLGEGTGAALAFHIIEAACRILDGMSTFSEAGVSERR